jgi:hypothetical protein
MCHLSGQVADPHAPIKCGRAQPNRPAFGTLLQEQPETNMIARVRALPCRLLEGEILTSMIIVEVADGSVLIGTMEDDASDDRNA